MADFDDFFNESDDEWIARSKKKIADHERKNPDTRTDTQKTKDHADFLERQKWKKQREDAQRQQIERFIKNKGTSNPRGGSY